MIRINPNLIRGGKKDDPDQSKDDPEERKDDPDQSKDDPDQRRDDRNRPFRAAEGLAFVFLAVVIH